MNLRVVNLMFPLIPFRSSGGIRLFQAKGPTWFIYQISSRVLWLSPPSWIGPTQESPINLLLYSQARDTLSQADLMQSSKSSVSPLISTLKDTKEPTGYWNVTGQTLQHPPGYRPERAALWFPRQGWQGGRSAGCSVLIVCCWVSHTKAGNN